MHIPSPDRFCPHCGAPLFVSPPAPTSTPPQAAQGSPGTGQGIVLLAVAGLVVVAAVVYIYSTRDLDIDLTDDPITTEPTFVELEYRLTGSAAGADITYTDGSGNIQQQTGLAVPLTKKSDGTQGMSFRVERGSFVSFSAQNTGDSGDLDCEIRADGDVINRGHASGAYAIVSCSATVP